MSRSEGQDICSFRQHSRLLVEQIVISSAKMRELRSELLDVLGMESLIFVDYQMKAMTPNQSPEPAAVAAAVAIHVAGRRWLSFCR